jgi:hypothetical protein
MANALKFADGSDDIIEGPGMPFGGPIQGKDIDGEDFGPDTDFCIEWFGESGRPLLYHHGLDGNVKTAVVGRQIGFEVHDDAVWVRSQLDKSSRYHKVVSELIAKGALGYSSGAMPHLVTKSASGHITRWPWVELSLTPTPANPAAQVYAVKASDALEHLEAVDVDVPAPLQAALKALDEWADHNDTTDGSGNAPYTEHGRRVYADLSDFVTRSQARYEARIKAGRELSTDNWKLLRELRDMAARLDELLERNSPEAAEAAKALDLELLISDLRLNGVAV